VLGLYDASWTSSSPSWTKEDTEEVLQTLVQRSTMQRIRTGNRCLDVRSCMAVVFRMNVSDAFCFLNVWFRIRGMLVSGISVQWEQFITRTSSAASGLDQCPTSINPRISRYAVS